VHCQQRKTCNDIRRPGTLGIMHESTVGIFAILPISNLDFLQYNLEAYLCTNLKGGTKV
jgi:hypothetical protein